TFRSAALLYFGEPFPVEPVPLAQGEEPPAEPVRELTARIQQALAAVTLQAGQAEVHALVDRAQRIVSTQDETPATPPSLADEFALRRRLLAGYEVARAQWPERLAAIATRIDRYEAALSASGLDARQLTAGGFTLGRVSRYVVKAALVLVVLLPAALVGVVTLAVAPRFAYAALVLFERLDRVIGGARALGLFAFRRWAFLRLLAERKGIQEDILALGRDIGAA